MNPSTWGETILLETDVEQFVHETGTGKVNFDMKPNHGMLGDRMELHHELTFAF